MRYRVLAGMAATLSRNMGIGMGGGLTHVHGELLVAKIPVYVKPDILLEVHQEYAIS